MRRSKRRGRARVTKAKKTVAPAKAVEAKPTNFNKKPRDFGIGGDIQPKRDLTRFVRWPKYVRLQRQRRVLYKRLKVPPSLNQFNHAVDKNLAASLFKLMNKYRPEAKAEKKERLQKTAEAKEAGNLPNNKKPVVLKFGINHITTLVEEKKAQLVIIAHDVDPIELVLWLPALCRKMDVPYCIVKGKSRLGQVVHQKTCTAVAFTNVGSEDKAEFTRILTAVKANFNDRFDEIRRQWGGGVLGQKSMDKVAKLQAASDKEAQAKAKF